MGKTAENQHVFLVAMGMEEVITGYESALKAAGFFPKLLGPAGLHQFNFYCDSIPETGTVAYLALFDEYIVLFVFSGGIPIFYRMTHQGMLGPKEGSAINDLDLLIQYYRSEFADVGIEKYYIASPIKSETRVQHILQDIDPIDFTILDETEMIRVVQQEQIFRTWKIRRVSLLLKPGRFTGSPRVRNRRQTDGCHFIRLRWGRSYETDQHQPDTKKKGGGNHPCILRLCWPVRPSGSQGSIFMSILPTAP